MSDSYETNHNFSSNQTHPRRYKKTAFNVDLQGISGIKYSYCDNTKTSNLKFSPNFIYHMG